MDKFYCLQLWRCEPCKHSFYTNIDKKQVWYRRLFRKRERIQCPICKELTAIEKKVVTKEIMVDEDENLGDEQNVS